MTADSKARGEQTTPSPNAASVDAANARTPTHAWDLSFGSKLLLAICGMVLLTGVLLLWISYRTSRTTTEALVDSLFREASNNVVTHTRGFVQRAAPLVESLAQLADQGLALADSDRLARQLTAFLKANPGMSWVHYGDEAGTFTGIQRLPDGALRINQSRLVDGRSQMVEHDVQPDGSWKPFREEADSGYDPRERPFYKKAKQEMTLVWLPPYVFYDQGIPGITCSVPVRDSNGQFQGVISADFDLIALSDFVGAQSVSAHSLVFLFTPDSLLLAHPNQRNLTNKPNRDAGKLLTLADTGDPLVLAFRDQAPQDFFAGAPGRDAFHFFQFDDAGNDYLASTTAFPIGNGQTWVVGVVAPAADFLAPVWRSRWLALAAAAVALLLSTALAIALARRISKPVQSLIAFMHRVGEGDLEAKADFRGGREFRQLSAALNRMIADLRDRLRLRHSLDVAMEVQQQLLPRHAPQVVGLDIAGHSTYCDETGGDYYDFLFVDEPDRRHVLIALGDVMGHGVAAALVMAGVRAVLRDRADSNDGLAELMRRLNRMMAADLEGSRFMTMHLGIMDTQTGIYRWVSAGHDPAIVYDPATGNFAEQDGSGMPLGIVEDASYEEHTLGPLKPGQILFLGTDGVWEMPNAQGELFGKDRVREVIQRAPETTAEQISQSVRDTLFAFRGDHRAVDDVTFVIAKAVAASKTQDAPLQPV